MTKINKDEFEFLDKDFPENPTREQVEHEIRRLQNLSKVYYNKQWAEKTIINSSYGALASKYFVGFNLKVASSVTEMGRNIVRYGASILNKYFDEYWPLDKELHQKLGLFGEPIKPQRQVLRYGDTDSVYFSVEDIVDDLISRNLMPQKYIDDTTQFCLDIVDLRLNAYIDEAYDRFAAKFDTVNIQKFELENILYNTIFVAKKKYVGDIAWKEGGGKSERNKKLKITGIEIIQSSTPKFARETLQDLVKYIFENVNNFSQADLIAKLNNIKNEFKMQPIEDISYSRSIGDYEKFILEDKSEFKINGGCPIHVRGAGYHNYLLNTNEEYKNKYKRIKTSDKIKFYYATDPVCNSFSYLAGNYPYEVAPEMDIDLQFEKSIIDPINRLLIPFGVGAVRPNLVTTRALF